MSEPMSEERLAEIEERHRMYPISTSSNARHVCPKDMESPCEALELAAEVRRLREMIGETDVRWFTKTGPLRSTAVWKP